MIVMGTGGGQKQALSLHAKTSLYGKYINIYKTDAWLINQHSLS
jgi:hypothetical protein